jgi:PAS domain S-box-containing protein
VFGAELHYRTVRTILIGVALPTAASLLLIAVGMLLERPGAGVMRVAASSGPGGRQLRRFMLPALLLPVVLGLVVIFPLRAVDREGLSVVVAVLASAMTLVGLMVLMMTAISLNRTYEALESSRAHMHALVEQAPDGVFVANVAGRYTDVNGAGCRMVGYTREEILQMSITDLIEPGEAERLFEIREQLLAGQSGVSRWTLRRKDGSHLPVEVNAKIFPDGRWQGQVRDISERARLERELRAAEAEQKFLAELGSALVSTIARRCKRSRGGSPPRSRMGARSRRSRRTGGSTPASSPTAIPSGRGRAAGSKSSRSTARARRSGHPCATRRSLS